MLYYQSWTHFIWNIKVISIWNNLDIRIKIQCSRRFGAAFKIGRILLVAKAITQEIIPSKAKGSEKIITSEVMFSLICLGRMLYHFLLATVLWWEFHCLNCLSLKGKKVSLSQCFQDFFLCLQSSEVHLWHILAWTYLSLSCLGFAQLLKYVSSGLFSKFEFSAISF